MKKSAITGFCCSVLVLSIVVCSSWAQETKPGSTSVSYPEPVYAFDPVYEGISVVHAFVIQNKGSDDLEVKRVDGG
jgi:hypothetical protein